MKLLIAFGTGAYSLSNFGDSLPIIPPCSTTLVVQIEITFPQGRRLLRSNTLVLSR